MKKEKENRNNGRVEKYNKYKTNSLERSVEDSMQKKERISNLEARSSDLIQFGKKKRRNKKKNKERPNRGSDTYEKLSNWDACQESPRSKQREKRGQMICFKK